jgi:hypothetical protein
VVKKSDEESMTGIYKQMKCLAFVFKTSISDERVVVTTGDLLLDFLFQVPRFSYFHRPQ